MNTRTHEESKESSLFLLVLSQYCIQLSHATELPKKSAASASTHALNPSRWYAANIRGVKNWLAVLCSGNTPQRLFDSFWHFLPRVWQHSEQQKAKESTSSAACWGLSPHLAASRSTSMSRNASFHVTGSSVWTPLSGCLGETSSISPSPTLVPAVYSSCFS